ncbi:MAG TPA: glycosyltransferase family 2 protein [Capsulimonadaceae bacterium]|jgi:cellulose synthase/poly-beta-1,6-N-acetylglucosamine synthase-like glycosyltransferase
MTKPFLILFATSWAIVLYTYVVYPIVLAVVAKLVRARDVHPYPLADDALPTVTMIVAAHDEADVLPAKLANTWEIDYPADKLTLLVGSDGSSDATEEILAAEPDPRLRSFPFAERRGKISVLNDLVGEANGDILVMSDANTIYAPDAVRRLVAHFADERIGCVSGELRLDNGGGVSGEGLYWKYENWIKRNSSRLGFLIGCNGGIYAIRRSAYVKLREDTIVDDFVICLNVLRQGSRVILDRTATATEPACDSAADEMVRKIRIGAGGWQAVTMTGDLLSPTKGIVAAAYWSQKVLRWASPVFILLALIANVALVHIPAFAALLAIQVAGIAISATAAKTMLGSSIPKALRPITYFYLMNYALLCGLWRFLTNTQRVTWERGTTRS